MSVVSDVEIRLRADIARLRQDLQDARREVTGALGSMSAAAEAFKGVLGGIAAGLSVGAFAAFIKQSIDAADALNDMSVRTKVAIEDLAGLAYAAKLGDTSLDGVASSISKLGQNIGKEGAKFRALGITATEPLEAFKQLADVFKNIQDPQQRAAFGAEALGKSWQEAAVLLEGGSEGIAALIDRGKELSGVTEQVAADAGLFNDKLDELSFAAQGAGTRIAAGLLPTLQKIADSFSADSVNGDKFAGTVTVLSAALKGLYSVGVGVSALFVGLGKSIGGTAAVAVAALSGDFKGALDIYKTMAADVYTGLGDAAIQIAKVWVDTGKSVVETAKATDKAVDNSAKVAAFLAGTQAKAAADANKIAVEAAKWAAKAIEDGNQRIVLATAEMESTTELTAEQKKLLDVFADLVKYSDQLSDAQKRRIADNGEEALRLERLIAARKADVKATQEAEDAAKRDTDAAWDKVRAMQEQVKTYGLTEEAIGRLQVVEYQRQLAAGDLSEVEQQRLTSLLGATEEQIKLQTKLAGMKADTTFWDGLESTAHQTFLSIANGGKDVATRLKDTFKNVFFDWLYQQTIKKWIINVGMVGTTSAAGAAESLASGGGSGVGGLINMGKSIYEGFATGFAGAATSLGGTVGSLGSLFGSEALSAFGAGLKGGALGSSTASAASGYAGTGAANAGAAAAPYASLAAGAAVGFFGGNMISGQYGSKATTAIGTAIGAVIAGPLGAAVGGLIGGVVNRAFGMGNKKVTGSSIEGMLSPTGATGNNLTSWTQKGGWFRSNKSGTDATALSGEQSALFASAYKGILDLSKVLGDTVGVETGALSTRMQKLSIDFKGLNTDAEKGAAVTKFFEGVANTIAAELVPSLSKFAAEGETASATLVRLVQDYQSVDNILTATGQSIKLFGLAGIEARENMIAAAGGLEALASGVSYFQQNFLTDAQRLAPLQKQVADALAAMGKSAITTNDQFRDAVLGIDLNTKAGADLYVQMLALAPAFKTVTDATIAAAQESARAAEQLAAAKAAEELERIAEAARLLSSAVDSAMSGLERSVQAQKDSNRKAFDDLMKSIGASIDTATGKVDELKTVAAALSGGIATPSSVQGEMSRAAARAALSAAAQVAKSGGGLPGAAAVTELITALRADSADNYGSMIEYQRAAAAANRDIASLAGVADTELTLAQKTLAALQDQRLTAQLAYEMETARLDGILAQGQAMVDKLNGIYGGVLAIPEALAALALSINAAMANSLASAGATTQGAYGQFLNRAASPEEVAYWREQAAAGRDITSAVASSEEAKIQALYQKYLGRAGEGAGVDFYEAQLASGKTWQQIEAGFAGSAEAQGRSAPGAMTMAIDTLNVQMAGMQTSMNRTAAATTKLAEQFDQVSGGGNALFTETA